MNSFCFSKVHDFCNLDNPLCRNAKEEINFAPFSQTPSGSAAAGWADWTLKELTKYLGLNFPSPTLQLHFQGSHRKCYNSVQTSLVQLSKEIAKVLQPNKSTRYYKQRILKKNQMLLLSHCSLQDVWNTLGHSTSNVSTLKMTLPH